MGQCGARRTSPLLSSVPFSFNDVRFVASDVDRKQLVPIESSGAVSSKSENPEFVRKSRCCNESGWVCSSCRQSELSKGSTHTKQSSCRLEPLIQDRLSSSRCLNLRGRQKKTIQTRPIVFADMRHQVMQCFMNGPHCDWCVPRQNR